MLNIYRIPKSRKRTKEAESGCEQVAAPEQKVDKDKKDDS